MKKLIIFDLDGTLLNTIEDLGEATNYALARIGFPSHPLSAYNMMVGNGVGKLLERALPSGHDTEENMAKMRNFFTEYYEKHCTDHSKPYPGIINMLESLRDAGVKLAVASNKYQAAVEMLIKHFFPMVEWAGRGGSKRRDSHQTRPIDRV